MEEVQHIQKGNSIFLLPLVSRIMSDAFKASSFISFPFRASLVCIETVGMFLTS